MGKSEKERHTDLQRMCDLVCLKCDSVEITRVDAQNPRRGPTQYNYTVCIDQKKHTFTNKTWRQGVVNLAVEHYDIDYIKLFFAEFMKTPVLETMPEYIFIMLWLILQGGDAYSVGSAFNDISVRNAYVVGTRGVTNEDVVNKFVQSELCDDDKINQSRIETMAAASSHLHDFLDQLHRAIMEIPLHYIFRGGEPSNRKKRTTRTLASLVLTEDYLFRCDARMEPVEADVFNSVFQINLVVSDAIYDNMIASISTKVDVFTKQKDFIGQIELEDLKKFMEHKERRTKLLQEIEQVEKYTYDLLPM